MRLLFDQNLSSRLVRKLVDVYPGSEHVRQSGLHEAGDEVIWGYAAARGFIIVSKDSDFHEMSFLSGHPPKVVWLRVGNGPTEEVAALLCAHCAAIEEFAADAETAFLSLG